MKHEVYITQDGSPSLIFYKDQSSQMMHSCLGAFSETEYIYGAAFDKISSLTDQPIRMLSIGLGFSYVELSAIMRANKIQRTLYIDSYESEDSLKQALLDFLNNKNGLHKKEYTSIFSFFEDRYKIPSKKIKELALELVNQKRWRFYASFNFQTSSQPYHLIQYDAFCSKFQQDLWQEAKLTSWLQQNASSPCVFATYAAKSSLKRSLKANDFELLKKEGFAAKRESTLALRI